jgi:hypothetical protein
MATSHLSHSVSGINIRILAQEVHNYRKTKLRGFCLETFEMSVVKVVEGAIHDG